ncbi:DoxX subfamily [Rhodobacteraceae bacterium WD3A24]|nr:DoxX subfamily [Rhodobacteraceae bacterium WD3A24]
MTESAPRSKLAYWSLLAVKALTALAFVMAGGAKLMGVEMMVATFDAIGLGQWFRYLTALIEIGGAVLIFVPGAQLVGALLLGATMIGAILSHLLILGPSAMPATVLLVFSAIIAWAHRDQARKFL